MSVTASNSLTTFNLYGTPTTIDSGNQTTVFLRGGNDVANVFPHDAAGNLTITTNVGIVGEGGTDTVNVQDAASAAAINYSFSNPFGAGTQNIFGLGGGGLGTAAIENLVVNAGTGDDTFVIERFLSPVSLTMNAGGGDDTLEITPISKNLYDNMAVAAASITSWPSMAAQVTTLLGFTTTITITAIRTPSMEATSTYLMGCFPHFRRVPETHGGGIHNGDRGTPARRRSCLQHRLQHLLRLRQRAGSGQRLILPSAIHFTPRASPASSAAACASAARRRQRHGRRLQQFRYGRPNAPHRKRLRRPHARRQPFRPRRISPICRHRRDDDDQARQRGRRRVLHAAPPHARCRRGQPADG